MSIPFTGRLWRASGVVSAIAKQMRIFTIKPVKQITVQFDPFHEKAETARKFAAGVSARRIQRTNLTCALKTNIVCDRSEPTITCDLASGDRVLFKCNNFELLDILKLYNKHISALAPPEPEEPTGRPKKLKSKKRRGIRISRHRR